MVYQQVQMVSVTMLYQVGILDYYYVGTTSSYWPVILACVSQELNEKARDSPRNVIISC